MGALKANKIGEFISLFIKETICLGKFNVFLPLTVVYRTLRIDFALTGALHWICATP